MPASRAFVSVVTLLSASASASKIDLSEAEWQVTSGSQDINVNKYYNELSVAILCIFLGPSQSSRGNLHGFGGCWPSWSQRHLLQI